MHFGQTNAINNQNRNKNYNNNLNSIDIVDNLSMNSNQSGFNDKLSQSKRENLNYRNPLNSDQNNINNQYDRKRSFPRQGSNQSIERKFSNNLNDNNSVNSNSGYSNKGMPNHRFGLTTTGSMSQQGRFGKEPKMQAMREEIELSRSKNKALISVIKEKFPNFLKRLDEMRATVQLNICYSFTTRLRDIWSSYVKDQKQRNANIDEKKLMNELTPIEQNFVEFLSARTDMLVNEIRIKYVKDIRYDLAAETAEEKQPALGDP